MSELVFYPVGGFHYEDAYLDGDVYKNGWGQTLETLNSFGGNYVLISLNEARERIRSAARKPVREITEAEFTEKLYMLPPMNWRAGVSSQSFKFMEMICQDVTDIFAEVDGRFFTLADKSSLSHEQIINRITEEVLKTEEKGQ